MNSDNLIQLLQKGFRVTLGATASLIEILQDPYRRDENLSKLRTELAQLADELAEKGALTEQEARNFVDTVITQRDNQTAHEASDFSNSTTVTPTATTTTTASPDVQLELQELTAQIAAIRAELENLRNQDSL
jgi:polyhydroxyalkanoate synthesis regulator phasin